jgi:hypothetical protein
MESDENTSDTLRSEEQNLLNEIQTLRANGIQALGSINARDINEIRVYAKPPQTLVLVLVGVFQVLDFQGNINTWEKIKPKLKQNQFLSTLFNLDLMTHPLTAAQVTRIRHLYDSNPNLNENVRQISKCVYFLSVWLESVLRISLKQQMLSDVRNRLRSQS